VIEFLAEYGLFLAKALTIVVAILVTVGGVVALSTRSHLTRSKEGIEVKHLNQNYENMANALQAVILPKKLLKQTFKARKKQLKVERGGGSPRKRRVFVVSFHGDIRGSAVASLREEVTAILTVAGADDEVVVRLESGGGLVHAYGLAASQLLRIKAKGLRLTVAVDKVAASGGYMMACVADHVLAAPFAVVGSIGVVSQIPNFHRLLQKNDIDFEQFTGGEYKRTVTVFGENTDAGREKFQAEIEDTHRLFKEFVNEHRKGLDIPQVATGEHWFGARALELKLVDELRTSDDYLLEASNTADLYEVSFAAKKHLAARLMGMALQRIKDRLLF
jgi:serine protease SohB